MKKLTLLFTIFFSTFYINAQNVAINNDGSAATSSAMLDVKSTTKGLLIPRMSSSLRTGLPNPVLGLLVFDTDTKTIWAHNGTSWSNLSSAGGGGSLTLPFNQTVNEAGVAFKITNTGTAIQGISSNTSTAALSGNNNSAGGIGVLGSTASATGIGVSGQSTAGTGVFGLSPDGVGVKASSTNGIALQVNGNLKISGGNTNPGNGAVLTSDASGNAVWKANRVAFRGFDINDSYVTIPWGAEQQIYYAYENYDFSNGFTPFASGPKPANASTFTIPVDGVYHLEAAATLYYGVDDFDAYTRIALKLNRNGVISDLSDNYGIKTMQQYEVTQTGTHYHLKITGDFLLLSGDKIYVEVTQYNSDDETALILKSHEYAFTGHLVIAY